MTRAHLSTKARVACFEAAGGICDICGFKIWPGESWDISHRVPLAAGGEDTKSNRFPVHRKCHRRQTSEIDQPHIAKTRHQHAKHIGAWKPKTRPMGHPTLRRKMDGTVVEKRR